MAHQTQTHLGSPPELASYYAGRPVVITGADGFIGSHLTDLLLGLGAEVTALSHYNSFNSWGWLEAVAPHPRLTVKSGDIRDPFFCRQLLDGADTVFHLAALIAIPYSYIAPQSYVGTNVSGTLNVCEAARQCGSQRLLHVSTSEVYGTAQRVPISEDHPWQPQSPYSASKIGADAMAMSYFNAFDLPVVTARPFNTYGPRQSARAVIPTVITQIAAGARRLKLGDVSPTRDFNYVADTCRGMALLAACDEAVGKTVNIGSNFEISVGDTVALIAELMGSAVEIETEAERLRPGRSEVFRLWCDNSLIRALTGFEPAYDLRRGLAETIAWFTDPANLKGYKSALYNV
ncbi:MAG: NAD-dependent 4,6-dehydratase LegB [Rhodothalassiaceae bacterium]